jgi:apoptosis-inducing factor 3
MWCHPRRVRWTVLGPEVGDLVRRVHEEHGVVFYLGMTPAAFDGNGVALQSGERLEADFVVVGIGVRPRTALAEQSGITVDRGVMVSEYLETSIPGIYAAGDIARWPDRRVHPRERFDAVLFFWTSSTTCCSTMSATPGNGIGST